MPEHDPLDLYLRLFRTRTDPDPDAVAAHLAGDGPPATGVSLLRSGRASWACLEYPDPEADPEAIQDRVDDLGLPATVTAEPSAVLVVFTFRDPIRPPIATHKIQRWRRALDLERTPAGQLSRTYPYAPEDDSRPPAEQATPLPFYGVGADTFARLAREEIIPRRLAGDTALLNTWALVGEDDLLRGAPPCLQERHALGIPPEEELTHLKDVGAYLRLRFPTDWLDRLRRYNAAHGIVDGSAFMVLEPGDTRRGNLERALQKGPALYVCDRCDKATGPCAEREYGVYAAHRAVVQSGTADAYPEVRSATMHLTDPPLFTLNVVTDARSGATTEVLISHRDLLNQQKFRESMMAGAHVVVPYVKQKVHDLFCLHLLREADREDCGMEGTRTEFFEHVEDFLHTSQAAKTPEDIMKGVAIEEAGRIHFCPGHLGGYLERRRFYAYTRAEVFRRLQSAYDLKQDELKIGGEPLSTWSVPADFVPDPREPVEFAVPERDELS